LFIDDNYAIIESTLKKFTFDKTYVLPDYKFSRHLQDDNIYHVKVSVSDLKNEDFVKAAEEYKVKKEQGLNTIRQENQRENKSSENNKIA
jgi:hypothetical protein